MEVIVEKEIAAVEFQSNRVSSYVFKRPYGWEELPNDKANDHGCNWNYGDVLYSALEIVVHRETSAVAIYCFGPQKTIYQRPSSA